MAGAHSSTLVSPPLPTPSTPATSRSQIHPHQIPFNVTPVHHAPSPLAFGFGFASTLPPAQQSPAASMPGMATAGPSSSTAAFHLQPQGQLGCGGSQPQVPSWGAPPHHTIMTSANAFGQSATSKGGLSSPSGAAASAKRKAVGKRRHEDEEDEDEKMGSPPPSSPPSASSVGGGLTDMTNRSGRDREIRLRTVASKRMRATNSGDSLGARNEDGNGGVGDRTRTLSDIGKGKRQASGESDSGVDLGKMLTSLDKPTLVNVLTTLLRTSPPEHNLTSTVLALLPTPSLVTVESALEEAERKVREAMPYTGSGSGAGIFGSGFTAPPGSFGWGRSPSVSSVPSGAGGGGARDEYVWSRVRPALSELVNSAMSYFPLFCPADVASSSGSEGGSSSGIKAREAEHPSTTFAFLSTLTSALLRIENVLPPVPRGGIFTATSPSSPSPSPSRSTSALLSGADAASAKSLLRAMPSHLFSPRSPDPLLSILLPRLLTEWERLLRRICREVNHEGRIFGRDLVSSWGRDLVVLGTPGIEANTSRDAKDGGKDVKDEERLVRQTMDVVRSGFEREIGWLVGGLGGPSQHPSSSFPTVASCLQEATHGIQQHHHASHHAHQAYFRPLQAQAMADEEEL